MIYFILIIGLYLFFKFVLKIEIDFKSFCRKGFSAQRGNFGVYCYCGKQGKGKTYSVVKYLLDNKDKEIYCNIPNIKNLDYTYFEGFDELLKLRDKSDCIIVYDEIFTALTRTSKINTDVLDFLSQMRKRRIIFMTTAQEWLEINMTLRRYCRYQIECNMINLGLFSINLKTFYDAELMKWNQLENEYIAPLCNITISKCNKIVADSYDTNAQIKSS